MTARNAFYVKQGDTGRDLSAQLTGSDGRVQDLTGATAVRFRMRALSAPIGTYKVDQPAVIDAPSTSGRVRYAWQAGDVDTPGNYRAEFIATFAGREITFPTGPSPDDYIAVIVQPNA